MFISVVMCAAESSESSFPTADSDSQMELLPALLKQHNLTLELNPNHSENMGPAQRVNHLALSQCSISFTDTSMS